MRVKTFFKKAPLFMLYVLRAFLEKNCFMTAAGLSYTTLLSLIPILAIAFSITTNFAAFNELHEKISLFLLENLAPESSHLVNSYLTTFLSQVKKTTSIGVISLCVTALALFASLENVFNALWNVKEQKPLFHRILIFWTLLTLGPLLIGAALSTSSQILFFIEKTGFSSQDSFFSSLSLIFSWALGCFAFSLLYLSVPNFPVQLKYAAIGGLFAGTLFQISHKGFLLYVKNFPFYEFIYGALSVIPLFILWMYICWMIILLGALISVHLPRFSLKVKDLTLSEENSPALFGHALYILSIFQKDFEKGVSLRLTSIASYAKVDSDMLYRVLKRLQSLNLIEVTKNNHWVLKQDLAKISLYDLYSGFHELPHLESEPEILTPKTSLLKRLHSYLEKAMHFEKELMTISIEDFLKEDALTNQVKRALPKDSFKETP